MAPERPAEQPLDILGGLSPEQARAVTLPAGPALVVAAERLPPEQVLAIAFTNRAARELATRVAALIGEASAQRAAIATFHSACHRFVVRPNAERLGRTPAFSIYDAHDARRLIAQALRDGGGALAVGDAQRLISGHKARLDTPDELAGGELAAQTAALWLHYEAALERADALDLDDLIVGAVRLLSEHRDVRERLRRRFTLVLVDEYQGTNPAQARLLELLAGERPNLTAVGDEDQLVFTFRFADVGQILRFEQRFADARVVTLERNYRSARRIVEAAGRLIAHNRERRPKRVSSQEAEGPPVVVLAFDNEYAEAHGAARWCARLIDRGTPAGEVAVLFRTRRQSRPLEEALLVARVAYRVLGGQGFWEHAEVRDAVAYLSLIANPRDRVAFERALQRPRRGLGRVAVERFASFADDQGIDLISALIRAGEVKGIRTPQGAAASAHDLALAKLVVERRGRGLGATVAEAILASGLPRALRREGAERATERLERLRDIVRSARAYEGSGQPGGLVGFLAHAALVSSDGDEEAGRVSLATVHAAKGLEWRCVRVIGMEEGLMPPWARARRRKCRGGAAARLRGDDAGARGTRAHMGADAWPLSAGAEPVSCGGRRRVNRSA